MYSLTFDSCYEAEWLDENEEFRNALGQVYLGNYTFHVIENCTCPDGLISNVVALDLRIGSCTESERTINILACILGVASTIGVLVLWKKRRDTQKEFTLLRRIYLLGAFALFASLEMDLLSCRLHESPFR